MYQGRILFGLLLNTEGKTRYPAYDRSSYARKVVPRLKQELEEKLERDLECVVRNEYGMFEFLSASWLLENDMLRVCSKCTFYGECGRETKELFDRYMQEVMLRVNRILYVHHVVFPQGRIRYGDGFLLPAEMEKDGGKPDWYKKPVVWYELQAVEPVYLGSTQRVLRGEVVI